MKEQLIELLETFGYPVRLQGSFAENELYPDSFFTFWNDETFANAHYNNDEINFVWSFTVNFYSVDPALTNSVLLDAKALLKSNGWTVPGKGYDVPSDEPTHTGRSIDAIYIEK